MPKEIYVDNPDFQNELLTMLQELLVVERSRLEVEQQTLLVLKQVSKPVPVLKTQPQSQQSQQTLPFEAAVATKKPDAPEEEKPLPAEVVAFFANRPGFDSPEQTKLLQKAGVAIRKLKNKRLSAFSNRSFDLTEGKRAKLLFEFMLTRPDFTVKSSLGGEVLVGGGLWKKEDTSSSDKRDHGTPGTRAGSAMKNLLVSHGLAVIAPNSSKTNFTFVLHPDLMSKKSKKS